MKNRILSIISIVLFALITASCSGFMGGNLDYYYNQQQKPDAPDVDDGDLDEDNLPENIRKVTVFEVLGPNGSVDADILKLFKKDQQEKILSLLPINQNVITSVSTDAYMTNVMNISIVDNYAPNMNYINGTWSEIKRDDRVAYKTSGAGYPINAPMNVDSKDITFYMYKGTNPEYEATDIVNTISYGDGSESRVNRFMFYEVEGKVDKVGMSLWNMLVCVDTYTNLIFAFAYPSKSDAVGNPEDWAGLSKTFYENDPIGYIDDNGKFVIHDWYTKQLNKKEFAYTQKTGLSPYYDEYSVLIEVSMDEAFLAGIGSKEYIYFDQNGVETGGKITFSGDGKTITVLDDNATLSDYIFKSATNTKNAVYTDSNNVEYSLAMTDDMISLNFNNKKYIVPSTLTITAKSIKNIGMKSLRQDKVGGSTWSEKDEAYLTYAMRSAVYGLSVAPTYKTLSHKGDGEKEISGNITFNTLIMDIGGVENISGDSMSQIDGTNVSVYSISLDSAFYAQAAKKLGTIENDLNKIRSFNEYGTPNVVLSYDALKKGFTVDLKKSDLTNTTVTDSDGNDFSIKLGEEKDIVINFNNQSEITYTISL